MNTPSLASTLEKFSFLAFLGLLFWAPMPFGSNRPWALSLLFVFLGSITVLWLILFSLGKVSLPRRAWKRGRWALLILLVIPLWIFMQTLPLPRSIVEALSPRAAALHVQADWIPLSLDIAATRLYLLKSLACFCAFALVLVLVNSARRGEWLLWVIVISGVFQAAYGALMVLSGLEMGFFVEKYVGHGVATGTFVNRNHLAGYLVMCLAAGTGLLLSQLSAVGPRSLRDWVRATLQLLLSRKILLRVMLALMVIALVLTRSRMGNTAFFVALAVAGVVSLLCGRKFSPKLVLLLLSLFFIDAVIVGQWFGFEKVVERMERAAPASQARIDISASSSSILADFPLTGSGGGSYYTVFTYYQDVGSPGRYSHAHNDYLELASELGIPAFLILGTFLVMVCARAILIQKPDHTRLQRGIGFALVMVVTWLLIHSAVDFNLQIPANSVTLCAILGLAFARLLPQKPGIRTPQREMDKKPFLSTSGGF